MDEKEKELYEALANHPIAKNNIPYTSALSEAEWDWWYDNSRELLYKNGLGYIWYGCSANLVRFTFKYKLLHKTTEEILTLYKLYEE